MPRNTALLLAAAAAALALLVFWRSGADLDRGVAVAPGGQVSIDIELGSGFSFDHGSLVVTSHSDDEVRVVADVSGWGEYAVDVDVRQRGGDVTVVGRVEGFLHWAFGGPTVDVRVAVPQGSTVDARIAGGPLRLEDLVGPVEARVRGSDVTLRRADGSVKLEAADGDVSVDDVEGDLTIETRDSRIEVSGVRGTLTVRSDDGEIRIASVKGTVEAASKDGAIEIERVRGDVRAATGRGWIEVVDVEGDLEVATDRGRIEVEELEGAIRARSGRGAISVGFVSDPAGVIDTARGSIEVEVPSGVGFDLDAHTERGGVELDEDLAFAGFRPAPAVAAPPPPDGRARAREIAAEVHEKVVTRVRENLERGHQDGNWEELDWSFDWSWDDADGNWNWDWDDAGWDWDDRDADRDGEHHWGRRRDRSDRLVGEVNGGGKALELRTRRGSIEVEER